LTTGQIIDSIAAIFE